MSKSNSNVLQLNVGFILNEDIGYARDIDFQTGQIQLADNLHLSQFIGQARLTRTPLGILVDAQFQGLYNSACTRCLTAVISPLQIEFSELYVFPHAPDAELYILESRLLDLMPLVHQEMVLAEDIQVVCRRDCKGLCPQCGENLNLLTCDCETEIMDPRLSILKQLLDEA